MLKKLMVLAIAASFAAVSFAETGASAMTAPAAGKTAATPKAATKHHRHLKKTTHHKTSARTETTAPATK